MRLPFLLAVVALISCPGVLGAWGKEDDKPKQPGLYERLTRFYSWNDPKAPNSGYNAKKFEAGGMYSEKSYRAGEYAGAKMYNVKAFKTKSFDDGKKSWLGSLLFPSKKLTDDLSRNSRDSTKSFETKQAVVKEFADTGRKSPLSSKGEYSTSSFNMKGRTQGAINNDMHLQEKVKKGLTVDDVRKLLNGAH